MFARVLELDGDRVRSRSEPIIQIVEQRSSAECCMAGGRNKSSKRTPREPEALHGFSFDASVTTECQTDLVLRASVRHTGVPNDLTCRGSKYGQSAQSK